MSGGEHFRQRNMLVALRNSKELGLAGQSNGKGNRIF